MAWIAVSKDGTERIFNKRPLRFYTKKHIVDFWFVKDDTCVVLPKGTIKKLIGRDMTWTDEPIELK